MCQRVCVWTAEIIARNRNHAGVCPVGFLRTNSAPVLSSKSVRSPQPSDYPLTRSEEFLETLMNDQKREERDVRDIRGGPCSGLTTCVSDSDCDWSEKCCPASSCSATPVCLPARVAAQEAEPFGVKITSFSLDSDKQSAKIKWIPAPMPRASNTVFFLELKYLVATESDSKSLNEQSREEAMSDWMIVSNVSNSDSIHLDSSIIWPSTWYRFRIVQLSANEPAVVSHAVGPVKISKEIGEISEPRNITAVPNLWQLNIHDSESVDATIRWLPPEQSDIPVTRYKVVYTQYVPDNIVAILSSPPEFKKLVPGHVTHVKLEQLIPETTYRVDVQAISRLPSIRLRSPKSTVYIRTVALDEASEITPSRRSSRTMQVRRNYGPINEEPRQPEQSGLPPAVENLRVGEVTGKLEAIASWRIPPRPTDKPTPAIFDNDEDDDQRQAPLRYIVEWAPLSCIQQEPMRDGGQLGMTYAIRRLSLMTMNTSVILHTLLPTCFYEVSVTSLDPSSGLRGSKQTQTFRTPHCSSGSNGEGCIVGQLTTESTTKLTTSAIPGLDDYDEDQNPPPVHDLQFRPVADNGSILVQWERAPMPQQFEAVELIFSWSVYPSLEAAPGQIRRLNPNRTRVIMQNLKPGLLYVVSIVSTARRRLSDSNEIVRSTPARIVVLLATPTPSPTNSYVDNGNNIDNNNAKSSKITNEMRSSADHLSSSNASSFSLSYSNLSLPILLLHFLLTFSLPLRIFR